MSKKDYQAIAAAIKEAKRKYPNEQEAFEILTSAIAVVLKKDNPSFDYGRFWEAVAA
jgi:hypothetical protein